VLEFALCALTVKTPARAIRDAGIAAVTCWLVTNVVGTDCPFQYTVAEEAKFDPLTVSVKSLPPTITLAGDIEISAAFWLGGGRWLAHARLRSQRERPQHHECNSRKRRVLSLPLHSFLLEPFSLSFAVRRRRREAPCGAPS
jgi:hypothetical protein